jgi:hypothetical protein
VRRLAGRSPALARFLRAFETWEIDGTAETFLPELEQLEPLAMAVELPFVLQNATHARRALTLLTRYPFLWPSALTWAIAAGDCRARVLLTGKPPDVPFVNELFYHASICIGKRPWLLSLEFPDCRILRRSCPDSTAAIHFFLAADLSTLANSVPVTPPPSEPTVLVWRAWLARFGMPEFVAALLYVLIWNIQISTDPFSGMNFFRCAACLLVIVCEGDEALLREAIEKSVDILENSDCGVGINGDGLAEFCLVLNVAMTDHGQEMFRGLLARRARLVEQAPPSGSAKLGFCVTLIKGALYVPELRQLIEPQVFGTPIMRREWQAAIDYFIARATDSEASGI